MIIAEDRPILIIVVDVKIFDHLVPVVDPALLRCTSHVASRSTLFVLTLNDSSIRTFTALTADNSRREMGNMALNRFITFIRKIYATYPVDTNGMHPHLVSDLLHDSVNFGAQDTLDFSA